MKFNSTIISTDFKGDFCYTHARAVILDSGHGIMTTQPIRLSGIDVFYGMYISRTTDGGASWSTLTPSKTLTRRRIGDGLEMAMCDATPIYHEKTGKILLIGHSATYLNDDAAPHQRRYTLYSVYDEAAGDFTPFKILENPNDSSTYYQCGSGSAQCLILPDGDLLVPVYHMNETDARDPWHHCYSSSVMRCSFDGDSLSFVEMGNSISVDVPRGLYEPSLAKLGDEYFLALRNDLSGYVSKSTDGLNFSEATELVWDNGENVGNYCTQQHWITLDNKLYMVYTRRAADNGNVPRHRAPLFIAEFDTKRLCLIRNTEEITVPNRGARLGNFGCQSREKMGDAFIYAAEWMQTTEPDPFDYKKCMKYGSDNSIFVVRVTPDKPWRTKMKYKIVASDLDGTLLDSHSELGERNSTAIASLSALGVHFVPATGRTYSEIPDEIKNRADIRYLIISNGALVFDKESDRRIRFCMSKSESLRLFDILYRYDVHRTVRHDGECYAEALTDEGINHNVIDPNHVTVLQKYGIFPPDFKHLIRTFERVEVVSAYFHSDADRMKCKDEIESTGKLRAVLVGCYGLEIFSVEAGKGAALAALCDMLGISTSETIGVGDSGNDLSLIKTAGLGLAVKDAADSLISAADKVICSNDDGVVAYILDNFCKE